MARTIKAIQETIINRLASEHADLSASSASEWRLWTWIVATAIYTFEVVLDTFRQEIDDTADKITPGTARWYVDRSKRFQSGHELKVDEDTVQLYYEVDDPAARIIDVVAVTEGEKMIIIKVAKLNDKNEIVPLTEDELHNFSGYIESVKFAGIQAATISTTADRIRYNVDVFFDPTYPATTIRDSVITALDGFRTALDFNSMFYKQRFVDAIMNVPGVVTVELKQLARKGTGMADFAPVGVADELESGYFDYEQDSTLTATSIKQM